LRTMDLKIPEDQLQPGATLESYVHLGWAPFVLSLFFFVYRRSISLIKQNPTKRSFKLSILTCSLATSSNNHSHPILMCSCFLNIQSHDRWSPLNLILWHAAINNPHAATEFHFLPVTVHRITSPVKDEQPPIISPSYYRSFTIITFHCLLIHRPGRLAPGEALL
jgi:hypothetical protein